MLDERLRVFVYGIWAPADLLSKFQPNRSRKNIFDVFLRRKLFSEASFPALLAEQFVVFRSHFWESLNFDIICLIGFRGAKMSFGC